VAEGDDFIRRLLVAVDAKSYSSSTANWQVQIQAGLLKVMDRAAARAGLDRASWLTQQAGDGELAVLPETEPEPRVVDDFVRHLAAELRRHNRDIPENKRLRLRVAIHFGPAIKAPNGYSGAGPIAVSRLCDSAPVRAALDATGAALAVILSQRVFSETVVEEHSSLAPEMFRRVSVRVKEFEQEAWVWVPEHDLTRVDLGPEPVMPPGPGSGPAGQPPKPEPSPGDGSPPRPGPLSGTTINGNFTGARVRAEKVVGGNETNHYGRERP